MLVLLQKVGLSMSRVEWSRYSGEDVEAVVAILLLLEHPDGRRIKPASGDGGIDVFVPIAPDLMDVYQVKRFTGPLTASHKRQIRASYERVTQYLNDSSKVVRSWHVVRPEDPTLNDEAWLAKLIQGAPFDGTWKGLSHLDGWSARHPEVIDYYLRDSKDRVMAAAQEMLTASRVAAGTPRDLMEQLGAIREVLGSSDPHFRYELSTSASPMVDQDWSVKDDAVAVHLMDDGVKTLRVDVYARYAQALEDRPLTIKALIEPSSDEENKDLKRFVQFGQGFSGLPAKVTLEHGLFPLRGQAATVSVVDAPVPPLMVGLLGYDEHGAELLHLPLRVLSSTWGSGGAGHRLDLEDATGVLSLELLGNYEEEGGDLTMRLMDPSSRFVAELHDTLSSLMIIDQCVRFSLRTETGGEEIRFKVQRTGTAAWLTEVPELISLLAVLKEIEQGSVQKFYTPLRLPPLAGLSRGEVNSWRATVSMLRGFRIQDSWDNVKLNFDSSPPEVPFRARVLSTLWVTIHDRKISLGQVLNEFVVGSLRDLGDGWFLAEPAAMPDNYRWLSLPKQVNDMEMNRVYVSKFES